MPTLLSNPLLQSIYSEELRLRNSASLSRTPINPTLRLGNWIFPKDKMIIVSSWHESRDHTVWNEGPVNGEVHPVDEFWAERFLVYPNDPSTGPRKPISSSTATKNSKLEKKTEIGAKDEKPYYTTEPVAGSYIPYGGGLKICKGRFYAKQEALGSMALFLMMFDIELVKGEIEGVPKPNMRYFPFGVVPPLGPVQARLRRRKWETA
jgi:cytochrome P450